MKFTKPPRHSVEIFFLLDLFLMQIQIKFLDGRKEDYNLEPEDSVDKVKAMLAEKAGMHKDQIRLIYQGQPMLDDKTLADQNVKAGSVIHMILQLRGGCL